MSTDERLSDVAPVAAPVRRQYVPAVGPRLRRLLVAVFVLAAVLGANSVYLVSVTVLEAVTKQVYQNYFYQLMFLGHLVLGLVFLLPFAAFAAVHLVNTRHRRNRNAVRMGYLLLTACVVLLASGVALVRLDPVELKTPWARSTAYWLHVLSPLAVGWLYWLHRLAGPPIRWRLGGAYAAVVAAACGAMLLLHQSDPRRWNQVGPVEGERYFYPSLARTASGNYIPAAALSNNAYCAECHADVHAGWSDSVHRFSSFNNPAYLASVRQTREFSRRRDGNVRRARWCAGCHDPVPFFSGAFDDPDYDDVRDPTAHAGITCTSCHSITHVNSTRGNADFTIEEPLHYPFAYSDQPILQWINRQLVKAKPEFHKKTFLKPLHRQAEFCSACHKVHLPEELNDYKFLRGQNHYDPFLLSGVSGHGARSFYYPPRARESCAGCHMPLRPSSDFGARPFLDQATGQAAAELSVHNHLFPAANTAIAHLRDRPDVVAAHQAFLKGALRVDVFGLREGGTIDGRLVAPLRPDVPRLVAGRDYLVDVVIRTLKLGHVFTQGTVDSNEVWLDVTVTSGGRAIGRSGALDQGRQVDPWSHFVNVFMLDRDGNRIDRRNPQDIFVPLYNNQIPPGAGQTVHFALRTPERLTAPVTVEVKLQYRKFDATYMDFVTRSAKPDDVPIRGHAPGRAYLNQLPITTLAVDRMTFPVEATAGAVPVNPPSPVPAWERWNDYGIGLLLKGTAELKQAAEAFDAVEKLGRYDGPLNLGRVYYEEGRLNDAVTAVHRAMQFADPPPPKWTVAWLSGLVNRQQGRLAEAEQNFRSVLFDRTPDMIQRGFDFSLDYEVINLLGETLFDRARQVRDPSQAAARQALLRQAAAEFERTIQLDPENITAHYNLGQLYESLGDPPRAARHRELHAKYKPDDNARDRAIALARKRYPAANHAAEKVVIYPLQRPGTPGLDKPATGD